MNKSVSFPKILLYTGFMVVISYLCGKTIYTYVSLFFLNSDKFGQMEAELISMAVILIIFSVRWYVDAIKKFTKKLKNKFTKGRNY